MYEGIQVALGKWTRQEATLSPRRLQMEYSPPGNSTLALQNLFQIPDLQNWQKIINLPWVCGNLLHQQWTSTVAFDFRRQNELYKENKDCQRKQLLLQRHLHEKEGKGQVTARDSVWCNATGELEPEGNEAWKCWQGMEFEDLVGHVTEVCCEEWEGGFRQRHHTWDSFIRRLIARVKRQEVRI